MFKRLIAIFSAAVVALFLLGVPAHAAPGGGDGNPHFIKSGTSASLSGSDLVVKFKEAGLSAGSTVRIEVTANLTATYQCINKGGHNPSDPKKTDVQTEPAASGEFTAGRNGSVTGTLTLSAPAASTVLDCPRGQTVTLTAWSYSNVVVTDLDSGATITLAGPYAGSVRVGR